MLIKNLFIFAIFFQVIMMYGDAKMQRYDTDITAFGPAVFDAGSRNQIIGALKALSNLTGIAYKEESSFLLPEGADKISAIRENISFSLYPNYDEFEKDIFAMMDAFMQKSSIIPQVFITVYNLTKGCADKDVDMLCRAVKEYYKKNNLGFIFTAVLTSKFHEYKYVDFINIPKHLLTFTSRIRLLQNKELRKKVLVTVGTLNNFNRATVREKNLELQTKIQELKSDADIAPIIAKLEGFCKISKKVVFCLGGRVDGNEIIFDIGYARSLYSNAERLANIGYGVVFVSGPRTPNDIIDFLHEKSLSHPNIVFHNCKRIAENDAERHQSQWRIYSGPNEDIFKKHQKLGNIYPAVAGFSNTLVVHTADTYSPCETANAGLPTAISYKGMYIDPDIRYDCINLFKLLCPKYAIDFDEFVDFACNMGVEPENLQPKVLSSPLRVFTETLVNRFNSMKRKSASKSKV